ncbi:MAG: hypothetical protein DRJ18_00035 [Candidatus Methanomethylicota archaeon]|nr:MAG: hypothetical protein DRJ18_00035 [Candidatus Verstraetearchaeota archaeon]
MIEWIVLDTTVPTYNELFKPDQAVVLFGFYLITWFVETAILSKIIKVKLEKLFLAVGTANWLTYLIGFFIYYFLYPNAELPSMLGFLLIYMVGAICLLILLHMHWFQPKKEAEKLKPILGEKGADENE